MKHSLGDSWCCIEGGTNINRGWQEFAIAPQCRHGLSDSTAKEWISDKNGMLTNALKTINEGDVVIVSLFGNDLQHGYADGNLTSGEIFAAVQALMKVVEKIKDKGANPVLLVYADPYRGKDPTLKARIALMKTLLKGVAFIQMCEIMDTSEILTASDHFNGVDFHPTEKGHRAIAEYILKQTW